MKLKQIEKNHTFRFLFPLLHDGKYKDNDFLTEGFDGIYIGEKEYEDRLILIYKPDNTQTSIDLDDKLTSLSMFNTDIDLKDGRIAYVFDTDDSTNISLFKQGRYSEFTKEFKDNLMHFWNLEINDPFHGILYKTEIGEQYYKDLSKNYRNNTAEGEYYPKPDMEKEYKDL